MNALVFALFIVVGLALAALAYRQYRIQVAARNQHNSYVVAVERFWTGKDEALANARKQAEKHFGKENTALGKREWALKLAEEQLLLAQSERGAGESLLADVNAITQR